MTIFDVACRFREDGSATLLGRASARDATGDLQASGRKLFKRADLASITLKAFNRTVDPATPILSATLDVADVIFDEAQTDWDADTVGYNFRYDVAATVMSDGGDIYRFEVRFETTGGAVAWASWTGPAEAVASS